MRNIGGDINDCFNVLNAFTSAAPILNSVFFFKRFDNGVDIYA